MYFLNVIKYQNKRSYSFKYARRLYCLRVLISRDFLAIVVRNVEY